MKKYSKSPKDFKDINFQLIRLQRGPIVGAHMTKTAELFGVARGTVLKVMLVFEEEEKNLFTWSKILEESESCLIGNVGTLTQIVMKDHKHTSPKITADVNDHFENPVSSKTVKSELPKDGFHGRAVIRNPYQN